MATRIQRLIRQIALGCEMTGASLTTEYNLCRSWGMTNAEIYSDFMRKYGWRAGITKQAKLSGHSI